MKKFWVLGIVAALFVFSKPARAVTMGDAALTVSISTVAGAVIGASTLPFYEDSGKHTKNIFYGAAIGAVAGVFIAAYAGVVDGPDEDAQLKRRERDSRFAFSRELSPERSSTLSRKSQASGQVLAWAPVAKFSF